MTTRRLLPDGLYKRALGGQVLYAHVVVPSKRRVVYIAGQLARTADGTIVGRGDMRAQIKQVGENLRCALASVGATLDDLVKTTTFVTDIDEFFKHADVRHEYFGRPMPTSTTVEVRRLADPAFLVEVEAVAEID